MINEDHWRVWLRVICDCTFFIQTFTLTAVWIIVHKYQHVNNGGYWSPLYLNSPELNTISVTRIVKIQIIFLKGTFGLGNVQRLKISALES